MKDYLGAIMVVVGIALIATGAVVYGVQGAGVATYSASEIKENAIGSPQAGALSATTGQVSTLSVTEQARENNILSGVSAEATSGDLTVKVKSTSGTSVTFELTSGYIGCVNYGDGSTNPNTYRSSPDTWTHNYPSESTYTAMFSNSEEGDRTDWAGMKGDKVKVNVDLTSGGGSNLDVKLVSTSDLKATFKLAEGYIGWVDYGDGHVNPTTYRDAPDTFSHTYPSSGTYTAKFAAGEEGDSRDWADTNPPRDTVGVTVSSPTPHHSLTVSADPSKGGTTSPSGMKSYEEGTSVDVTATPNSGYKFDYWSGASTSTSKTITVTMNSNKSLTAKFSKIPNPTEYYLTTETRGQGSVSAEGSSPYDEGALVKVTANPASGWNFDHWEGDVSGTSNPTYVTMDSNKTARAMFSSIQEPSGKLIVNGQDVTGKDTVWFKTKDFTFKTRVTEGVSNVGAVYLSIDGTRYTMSRVSGTDTWKYSETLTEGEHTVETTLSYSGESVTVQGITIAIKEEEPNKVTLFMKSSPVEGGSVTVLQSEKVQITKGTVVSLQAFSNSGYVFDHWSGDISGESKSVTITMDTNKTVIANFIEEKGPIELIISNIQWLLMALGSVILVGGIVKISG